MYTVISTQHLRKSLTEFFTIFFCIGRPNWTLLFSVTCTPSWQRVFLLLAWPRLYRVTQTWRISVIEFMKNISRITRRIGDCKKGLWQLFQKWININSTSQSKILFRIIQQLTNWKILGTEYLFLIFYSGRKRATTIDLNVRHNLFYLNSTRSDPSIIQMNAEVVQCGMQKWFTIYNFISSKCVNFLLPQKEINIKWNHNVDNPECRQTINNNRTYNYPINYKLNKNYAVMGVWAYMMLLGFDCAFELRSSSLWKYESWYYELVWPN